jgi:hypothetical protein
LLKNNMRRALLRTVVRLELKEEQVIGHFVTGDLVGPRKRQSVFGSDRPAPILQRSRQPPCRIQTRTSLFPEAAAN